MECPNCGDEGAAGVCPDCQLERVPAPVLKSADEPPPAVVAEFERREKVEVKIAVAELVEMVQEARRAGVDV